MPLVPQHVCQSLRRQLPKIIGEGLYDLQQHVYGEAVGEEEAEAFDYFARGGLCRFHLLLPDDYLSFDPLEEGEDAFEGAAEEHVMADAQKKL